jgi:hypothetical protein
VEEIKSSCDMPPAFPVQLVYSYCRLDRNKCKNNNSDVLPPRPILILTTPRPPNDNPFCSSNFGPQLDKRRELLDISASRSFDKSSLCRATKAFNWSSVTIVRVDCLDSSRNLIVAHVIWSPDSRIHVMIKLKLQALCAARNCAAPCKNYIHL